MIVVALIAVAAGVASLALRDPNAMRLENEAARLAALLESARAESRASGLAVAWAPLPGGENAQFVFTGLGDPGSLPQRWLDPDVQAQIVGAATVRLGPEPLIGAQRIVLRLADKKLELATDGLGPFAVSAPQTSP